MRILFDSKKTEYKSKFGTLRENEGCRFSIDIPKSCKTKEVKLILNKEDGQHYASFSMFLSKSDENYENYSCEISIACAGLYSYYFYIKTENEEFSLYKQGYDMTNIEEGDLWQLSVIPTDYHVPSEFFGRIMYQIFPDRFCKSEKYIPPKKDYFCLLHDNLDEIPCYLPDIRGEVLNTDFYGGNIQGIISKLDYLKELNVGIIYLNPIFKAFSNHRYDTGDYKKIDEFLGDESDFVMLCNEAHKRDIKIILDGVFSHTGSVSVYFKDAITNENSPYRQWYDFKNYPNEYTSWWGIKTLPCVDENNESYRDFIIRDEDSVVAHWLNLGADGFRLDVADELPDSFILELRNRMKSIKPSSLLIGEVWEDASNKCSYGVRRQYFTGGELDSVMNYPYRTAIINYCLGNDNGYAFRDTVMTIQENYPEQATNCLMNILSTHDTVRILTSLGVENVPSSKNDRAVYKLSEKEKEEGKARLFLASFLQFILPGLPCIYYGDEIGTEGFEDPFCRTFFDWSAVENNEILDFYKQLSSVRQQNDILKYGRVLVEILSDGVLCIKRWYNGREMFAVVNVSNTIYSMHKKNNVIFTQKADIKEDQIYVNKYGFILLS